MYTVVYIAWVEILRKSLQPRAKEGVKKKEKESWLWESSTQVRVNGRAGAAAHRRGPGRFRIAGRSTLCVVYGLDTSLVVVHFFGVKGKPTSDPVGCWFLPPSSAIAVKPRIAVRRSCNVIVLISSCVGAVLDVLYRINPGVQWRNEVFYNISPL